LRSLQRWQHCPGDRRPLVQRAAPASKLSSQKRRRLLEVANQPEFSSLPPKQIVARLADQGTWLTSESTFYRVLKEAEQQHPRGRSRPPVKRALTTHVADGPNQRWCWDITWLPTTVRQLLAGFCLSSMPAPSRLQDSSRPSPMNTNPSKALLEALDHGKCIVENSICSMAQADGSALLPVL
jgi:transposase InsO family protein